VFSTNQCLTARSRWCPQHTLPGSVCGTPTTSIRGLDVRTSDRQIRRTPFSSTSRPVQQWERTVYIFLDPQNFFVSTNHYISSRLRKGSRCHLRRYRADPPNSQVRLDEQIWHSKPNGLPPDSSPGPFFFTLFSPSPPVQSIWVPLVSRFFPRCPFFPFFLSFSQHWQLCVGFSIRACVLASRDPVGRPI